MRVRMKIAVSGLREGADWPAPGGEVDVPDEEGAQLCASGMAEPVVEDKAEKAVPRKKAETRKSGSA